MKFRKVQGAFPKGPLPSLIPSQDLSVRSGTIRRALPMCERFTGTDVGNMTATDSLYSTLRKGELDFFVSVPCKLLADLIAKVEADSDVIYTPVTREEEGVGMACGAHLAGRKPRSSCRIGLRQLRERHSVAAKLLPDSGCVYRQSSWQ